MFGNSGGFGSFGSKAPAVGFGTSTTQPTNAFGTTTSGFGSTAQPAAQSSFGGFGSTTAAPAFGAASTAAPAFGASSTPAFGASATPAFGSSTPAPAFGSSAAAPAFGSTATPAFGAPSTTTPSLGFGPTPAASAAPSFGGFGSSTGFGQTATQNKPASTFGGFGQTPAFGAPAAQQQFGAQAAPSTTGKIAKSIEKLQQAYAPYKDASGRYSAAPSAGQYNEECMFKTYMYDRRNGGSHISDPSLSGTLLEQAEINNPDPTRYYPVRILGIEALKARFDQQQAESLKVKEHLQSVREVIDTVELSNTQIDTRFAALQMRQAHLYQKLLALLRKVEVLRCRGSAFEQSEEKYRAYLHQILAAMKAPYLQIQELANNVAQQDFPQDVYADVPYDAAELEALYDALRRQREGLEYVTDILTKDVRDMKIVKAALQESGGGIL